MIIQKTSSKKGALFPFVIITSLFALWGLRMIYKSNGSAFKVMPNLNVEAYLVQFASTLVTDVWLYGSIIYKKI